MNVDLETVLLRDHRHDIEPYAKTTDAGVETLVAFEDFPDLFFIHPDAGILHQELSRSQPYEYLAATAVVFDGVGEKIVHEPRHLSRIDDERHTRLCIGFDPDLFRIGEEVIVRWDV